MNIFAQILEGIAKSTNNDAILLVIVIILGIVIFGWGVYPKITKARERKRQQYLEQQELEQREKLELQKLNQAMAERVIEVVEKNTEAYSKLALHIETNTMNCTDCKIQQTGMMTAVLAKQEEVLQEIRTTTAILKERGRLENEI